MQSSAMSTRVPLSGALALLAWLIPTAGLAQQVPLAQILPELLGNTIRLEPSHLPDQPTHIGHFQPGLDQSKVPSRVNEAVLTLLSTNPVGTPGGGFTYVFDPTLGSFTRSSNSFGPSFAERALTTGRGKASMGFGLQHANYDTFEGLSLKQRDIVFYVQHTECCSPGSAGQSIPDQSRLTPPFEGDLIKAALRLQLVSDTSTVVATYGLTDRFDFSLDLSQEDYQFAMIRAAVNNGVTLPPQALRILETAPSNVLGQYIATIGLELEARKAPLEVVVVDSASKTPTEN